MRQIDELRKASGGSISDSPAQNLTPAQEKLCAERIDHWTVAPDNYSLWDFARELLALDESDATCGCTRAQDLTRLQRDNAELRRKLDASL